MKSYLYALSRNNEFEVNSGMQNGRITFFSDRELRDIAKTMSFELFNDSTISNLEINRIFLLAKQLRAKTGSSIKQIARIVHLSPEALEKII